MKIHIVTAFPGMFPGVIDESILKRAQEQNAVRIRVHDLRDFTTDKHRSVDDAPYGGGPGMILKPEPIFRCVEQIVEENAYENPRIILTSAAGTLFDQRHANRLAADTERALIFICGHYKGIDERVREFLATDEYSIGEYVLTGGELAAMVMIDAIVRLLPDVLGDFDSALSDSYQGETVDHPHYTRPREFRGMSVPDVLLSGNHGEIEKWRREKAEQAKRGLKRDLSKFKIESRLSQQQENKEIENDE